MRLKQSDPLVGLRQVTKGYLCFQRFPLLDLIRAQTLTPTELGYYVIFLLSADWHCEPHRLGSIRHSMTDLAKIWGVSDTTLGVHLARLSGKGLVTTIDGITRITAFKSFTQANAKQSSKQGMTDEQIETYFSNREVKPRKQDRSQAKEPSRFNVPFKVKSNVNEVFTKEEWEKKRLENPDLPSWENKLLIEQSLADHEFDSFHK